MPTGHPERRWEGSPAALILLLVLMAPGLFGCSLPFGDDDSPSDPPSALSGLEDDLGELLDTRAGAVRNGNLTEFLDGVDSARPKFLARQERYFLNLRELPLGVFEYILDEGVTTLPDGRVQGVVQLYTRLSGYDSRPVRRAALFTFRQLPSGGWVLSEDRNRTFEADNDIEPQPWDLMRIQVKEGNGVLGVFDEESIDAAYQIIKEIEDGISVIRDEVPLSGQAGSSSMPSVTCGSCRDSKIFPAGTRTGSTGLPSRCVPPGSRRGWRRSGSCCTRG